MGGGLPGMAAPRSGGGVTVCQPLAWNAGRRRLRDVALAAGDELGVRRHGRVGLEARRPAAVAVAGEAEAAAGVALVDRVGDDRRRPRIGPPRVVDGARALAVRLPRHGRVLRSRVHARVHAGLRSAAWAWARPAPAARAPAARPR